MAEVVPVSGELPRRGGPEVQWSCGGGGGTYKEPGNVKRQRRSSELARGIRIKKCETRFNSWWLPLRVPDRRVGAGVPGIVSLIEGNIRSYTVGLVSRVLIFT